MWEAKMAMERVYLYCKWLYKKLVKWPYPDIYSVKCSGFPTFGYEMYKIVLNNPEYGMWTLCKHVKCTYSEYIVLVLMYLKVSISTKSQIYIFSFVTCLSHKSWFVARNKNNFDNTESILFCCAKRWMGGML